MSWEWVGAWAVRGCEGCWEGLWWYGDGGRWPMVRRGGLGGGCVGCVGDGADNRSAAVDGGRAMHGPRGGSPAVRVSAQQQCTHPQLSGAVVCEDCHYCLPNYHPHFHLHRGPRCLQCKRGLSPMATLCPLAVGVLWQWTLLLAVRRRVRAKAFASTPLKPMSEPRHPVG